MRNLLFSILASLVLVACTPQDHLTILHTNDTHSQVEPKTNDQGGYARRMGLIRQERKKDKHLLLVDVKAHLILISTTGVLKSVR